MRAKDLVVGRVLLHATWLWNTAGNLRMQRARLLTPLLQTADQSRNAGFRINCAQLAI
jgi:hypothetical protein